jgi:hypothetical protein
MDDAPADPARLLWEAVRDLPEPAAVAALIRMVELRQEREEAEER